MGVRHEPRAVVRRAGRVRQRYPQVYDEKDPDARIAAAMQALAALAREGLRLEVECLASRLADAGRSAGEAFAAEEWGVVARHFGPQAHAILAVYDHVAGSRSDRDLCGCPVGRVPDHD